MLRCKIDFTDNNAVYYYHFDGLGSYFDLRSDLVKMAMVVMSPARKSGQEKCEA